ncbi:MAG: SRPBCC family protein [Candidatus Marinimicrobia bacterium]|nr:SRPBCC family protein [Candidatus Neomarinimicrobiota bacterium]MCF7903927.1 SRPBCC family protein [Candidatus Neomarinimicrobiota bacterium]
MDINENAALKTSQEIEIEASVGTVWNIQTNIESWPDWQPEITDAKMMGSLELGSTFTWKSGGFKLTSTINKLTENSFIGWSGKGFGASAIHTWEFIALENGNTLLRTNESMDGWLVKLLKGMMKKKLHESLDVWLKALKVASESR